MSGDEGRYFAISLGDARESDVNARWVPPAQQVEAQPAHGAAQAIVPLWPELLVLALILLSLEWFVWIGSRGSA